MSDFSPTLSCEAVASAGGIFGDGVRTSGTVGGISIIGDEGMETPSLRFLGVVGDEEPEVCGDSDSSCVGWDSVSPAGGVTFGR